MQTKTSKNLGFISALSILVGSVVGIGIFFKNQSVAKGVNFDGLGWILTWIIGGIISMATAVCYGEIGKLKSGTITGLGSWSNVTFGKKFGHFIAINFTALYFGVDAIIIAMFTSEFFFSFMNVTLPASIAVFVHLTVGLLIILFLLSVKRYSIKTSGMIQTLTTGLKLLPLIIGVFVGIIVRSLNLGGDSVKNAFVEGAGLADSGAIRFFRIFSVVPAVLFAYDAFLNVASMTNRVKNGDKRVPYIILIGMGLIAVIYTLIAVSSIVTHQVSVAGIVALISENESTKQFLRSTVDFLIFVSAFGVTNGMVAVFNRSTQNLFNAGGWFGSPKLKARFGERGALFYILGITFFYYFVLLAVSVPFKTDVFLDGISNYPTFVFFFVYGLVIAGYTLKRNSLNVRRMNSKLFYSSAVVSIIGIVLAIVFFFVNEFIAIASGPISTIGWGGTEANNFTFPSYLPLVLLVVFVALMFIIDFLNRILAKKFEGRDIVEIVSKAST